MISAFGLVHKGPMKDPTGIPQMALRSIKTARGRLVPVRKPRRKQTSQSKRPIQQGW